MTDILDTTTAKFVSLENDDQGLGRATTTSAVAAEYEALRNAVRCLEDGCNDQRADDCTQRSLDHAKHFIELRLVSALDRLNRMPPEGALDINRLGSLIDYANRCGDYPGIRRLLEKETSPLIRACQ